MPKIDLVLPPYTIFRERAKWKSFYFSVPKKKCPKNWKPVIGLGSDKDTSLSDIIAKANRLYVEYTKIKKDEALGVVRKSNTGTIPDIIEKYRKSDFFTGLTPATKTDYNYYLSQILHWSEKALHPHISQFTPRALTSFLMQFKGTPNKRKRMKNILSLLYNVSIHEGYVSSNPMPFIKFARTKIEKRALTIWTDQDVAKFVAAADAMGWPSVGTAVLIAYETGQRMGDVLSLQKPRDYNDGKFIVKQSKTNATVGMRATALLKPRLDFIPAEQLMLVFHEGTGKKWLEKTFSHKVREIADSCGLEKHIFAQLRHSALLNAERSGLTEEELSHKFGWSRATVKSIRDKHYGLLHDEEISNRTVDKIDSYREKRDQKK